MQSGDCDLPADSKLVALIAYLQRIGRAQGVPVADNAASEEAAADTVEADTVEADTEEAAAAAEENL